MDASVMIVIMGVCACGKSTIASKLAELISAQFLDGDDLHSESSIRKMSAGIPLTDEDRLPWLRRIHSRVISSHQKVTVVACSALKLEYRDLLRGGGNQELITYFIYLRGSRTLLLNRLNQRTSHFMKSEMLDSQLETLEEPTDAEQRNEVVELGNGDVERGLDCIIKEVEIITRNWRIIT